MEKVRKITAVTVIFSNCLKGLVVRLIKLFTKEIVNSGSIFMILILAFQ